MINYRLKEAVILLLNTEKQIHIISNETGFNNVVYFCRIFKKRYHLTPSEYRKEKFIISTISS
ncbi:helix-turn-helix domain-containing protein [Lachnospiraceae bacterium TF09-5]|nr:helix-turn-helix domain-containing protein [Lachnospiraceae bacterium TF09-5]